MRKFFPFLLKTSIPILLFILGLIIRIIASSWSSKAIVFDEIIYDDFAENILKHGFVADCCTRSFGYPLLVAGATIIQNAFFNPLYFHVLYVLQIVLDATSGLLIYYMAKRLFSNKKISLLAGLLYVLNPWTASYTGYVLSEVWGIFLFTLALFFLQNLIESKKYRFWFLWSLSIALFAMTRLRFFWGSIAALFILPWIVPTTGSRKINAFLISILGSFIIFSYPIAANIKTFGVWTPLPPIPGYAVDFVQSFFVTYLPVIISEIPKKQMDQMVEINIEFASMNGLDGQRQKATELINRGISQALSNPPAFVWSRIRNGIAAWNKSHIFAYTDRFFPVDKWPSRIANGIFVALGFAGAFIAGRYIHGNNKKFLWFLRVYLLYGALTVSLLLPEERLTIPLYPIIALFAAVSIHHIQKAFH